MPKKVDHASRRDIFVKAADRTARKKGVAGATVRAVAKEAGFTTGALVHYVDSIDDLLLEASENIAQERIVDMSAWENLPDKLEGLRRTLYMGLPADPQMKSNWEFYIGLWLRSSDDPAMRKEMIARLLRWQTRITRLIRNAQKAGVIAQDVDARMATRVISALIDGIGVQVIRMGRPMPPQEQLDIVDQWILNWLKPLHPLPATGMPKRISGRRQKSKKP